jgi:diadenylate cyclase
MAAIEKFFQDMFYAIPTPGIMDIVDILVVALIIYKVLMLIRSTSAVRVARGILLLLLVTWITDIVNMYALNWILNKILELGVIALVIMFQPELRRALEKVGGRTILSLVDTSTNRSEKENAITATVNACEIMSREHIGVLLIFEREASLEEYFKTGTIVDARVTEQLLRNLFFPKASLHDGAVIIRNARVAAAGCVMPLSENTHLSSDLGTRHRAGIGTSEVSDAVVVIVSEETGIISVAIGGMLKRHLAPQTLEKLLTNELITEEDRRNNSVVGWIRNRLARKAGKNAEK